MFEISVIIVYTNESLLNKALSFLNQQTNISKTEIITIDNRSKKYSSASMALNYGAKNSQGKVLVFMHQDFFLLDNEILSNVYDFCCENTNSIIGAAGVTNDRENIVSDIYDTKDKIKRHVSTDNKLVEVVSLDECFMAMNRETWQRLKFDERTCDNWHLYGVDICYNNLVKNEKNFVIPMEAWHCSAGNLNSGFYKSLIKLILKYYKYDFQYIVSTCIKMQNNGYGIFKCAVKYVKLMLKNK